MQRFSHKNKRLLGSDPAINPAINPFKFGHIVSGDFFYDREDELLRIKQTLAGGNNITLYAPRRYGKSSLVNKVLKELDQEGYTTVYLDIMSVYSRDTFIKNYTRAIAEKRNFSISEGKCLKITFFNYISTLSSAKYLFFH